MTLATPAQAVNYTFHGNIASRDSNDDLKWFYTAGDNPTGVNLAYSDSTGFAAVVGNTAGGGTLMASGAGQDNVYFALAGLDYDVAFDAPATAKAKVTITAFGNISAWGAGYSVATFSLGDNVNTIQLIPTTGAASLRNFKWTRSIVLNGGQSVTVKMQAGAGVNSGTYTFRGAGGGMAYIDPVVRFGAVPEPGNWAMMIAGFGVVGAVSRRRRTAAMITA